jgi:hypothetical protein
MDETEQKIRLEKNLHAYVPIFEDAEWWKGVLPGIPSRRIHKALEVRREKRKRMDDLWVRR